jgi:hypothetical protein
MNWRDVVYCPNDRFREANFGPGTAWIKRKTAGRPVGLTWPPAADAPRNPRLAQPGAGVPPYGKALGLSRRMLQSRPKGVCKTRGVAKRAGLQRCA